MCVNISTTNQVISTKSVIILLKPKSRLLTPPPAPGPRAQAPRARVARPQHEGAQEPRGGAGHEERARQGRRGGVRVPGLPGEGGEDDDDDWGKRERK